ncbi:unnamed protein product [Lepeophtheirus salmonis]|uniref:(salmon louse) hypothetical protein n=1 Tax=Lepeophtheirus salmonis TaxID=72036 RepID=A0A7R8CR48_LEPSM|nr:unnamed protein product [Lepeophtheirus salmonis]CAF2899699.1 unnamed protein product [Lepeophtheirus salmonis]
MFYFENWASIEFRCPQEALTGSDNEHCRVPEAAQCHEGLKINYKNLLFDKIPFPGFRTLQDLTSLAKNYWTTIGNHFRIEEKNSEESTMLLKL